MHILTDLFQLFAIPELILALKKIANGLPSTLVGLRDLERAQKVPQVEDVVAPDSHIFPHLLQATDDCPILISDEGLGVLLHLVTEGGEQYLIGRFLSRTHHSQAKDYCFIAGVYPREKPKKEVRLPNIIILFRLINVLLANVPPFFALTHTEFNEIVVVVVLLL